MKKKHTLILVFLALSVSIFAQENLETNEYEELSEQVSSNMTVKRIQEIVVKAKILNKIKTKQFRNDKEELAKTTLDFAIFRKKVFLVLKERLLKVGLMGEMSSFFKLYKENSGELENLLEKTIDIYENTLKIENTHLATAKFELASSVESSNVPNNLRSSWKRDLEQMKIVQNLYLDSYKIWDKSSDTNGDMILITAFYLANSYLRSADFEKALPLYEKYIAGVKAKFGEKSENLLPALQASAGIWNMIDRKDEIEKIREQISKITDKVGYLDDLSLSITLRAKSFKYKGIQRKFGKIVNTPPVGVVIEGARGQNSSSPNTPIGSRLSAPVYTNLIGTSSTKVTRAGSVKVFVTIDKKGKVLDVKAETDDIKRKNKIEKQVKKWEFEPFIYKDTPMKITGVVYYYF